MQRRGAGGPEDRDDRVDLAVVESNMVTAGTLRAPCGNGLLLFGGFRDVQAGFAVDEVGQGEAERVGGAHVGEGAEHSGEVREVLVFAEAGDDVEFAAGVVFDGFDRGEEVGGHCVEVLQPGVFEGVGGRRVVQQPTFRLGSW